MDHVKGRGVRSGALRLNSPPLEFREVVRLRSVLVLAANRRCINNSSSSFFTRSVKRKSRSLSPAPRRRVETSFSSSVTPRSSSLKRSPSESALPYEYTAGSVGDPASSATNRSKRLKHEPCKNQRPSTRTNAKHTVSNTSLESLRATIRQSKELKSTCGFRRRSSLYHTLFPRAPALPSSSKLGGSQSSVSTSSSPAPPTTVPVPSLSCFHFSSLTHPSDLVPPSVQSLVSYHHSRQAPAGSTSPTTPRAFTGTTDNSAASPGSSLLFLREPVPGPHMRHGPNTRANFSRHCGSMPPPW